MEFGSGHDVRPGDDIAIDTSTGSEDLGQTTYDSNHDGLADSVIVVQGDHEYLITDADHDGSADSIRAFDSTGHEIDPSSGQRLGGSESTTGGAGQGSNMESGGYGTDGSFYAIDTATPGNPTATPGSSVDAGSLLLTGDDGSEHDLGAATVDLDRDGLPDTAVVREPDGAVVGYTDRDGDGIADQRTRIGADGDVVISVSDGSGGWEVAATGHLDDSGVLVEDAGPTG